MLLIFRYSAQILLENALFCRKNARVKNSLFFSKFCLIIYPSLPIISMQYARAGAPPGWDGLPSTLASMNWIFSSGDQQTKEVVFHKLKSYLHSQLDLSTSLFNSLLSSLSTALLFRSADTPLSGVFSFDKAFIRLVSKRQYNSARYSKEK